MARLQITDRSSPAERAEAANQLRDAQRELSQWIEDRRRDPATPREVFEGVDYGPLISATDVARQSRIIANRYDYVDFGDSSTTQPSGSIVISTGQFFVRGLGANPNVISVTGSPSTTLSRDNDSTIPPIAPATPQITVTSPATVGANDTVFAPAGIESRFDALSKTDSRISVQGPGPLVTPTVDNLVSVDQGLGGNNETAVRNENSNTDDSGSAAGTGLGTEDSPFELGEITFPSDPGRSNNIDSGSDVAGVSDGAGSTGGSNSSAVDVSELAKPRRAGSGSAIEENKPGVELRPNVLHDYANWTYGLSLYMLTPATHFSIVQNGGITDPVNELSNLLIKSGGTGSRGALGDRRDYYMENLNFVSVIGQNSRTARSSNNFNISFEIVEPYGVAFLAELVQLAILNGIEDHFEVPYLLEIKFRGYDEQGNVIPEIPESGPKYIPIKIINITFKVTSAATVYTVTAVPFAHSPLQHQQDAFINESISIEGQTFEELMQSLFDFINQSRAREFGDTDQPADNLRFVVHDEDLRTARVGFDHITDGNVISIDRQSMDGEQRERVQITGGSTLKSAIQAIAAATDFGARFNTVGQTESADGNENRPLRLLKIMPAVTGLRDYNTATKRYAKDITYRIDTQRMYGFVLPDMPGATPAERGWQKEYNWIFTGKNKDILDFQADYNVQYFNIRNVFTQAKGNTVGTPSAAGNPLPDDGLTRTEAGGSTYSPAIVHATSPITTVIHNSYRGAAHQLASDHMDNVLNNPGADMLVVDLSIIGDPDFIPQDRSILPRLGNNGQPEGSGDARLVNGSIATDVHDVFVMLRFKTPRDYNPEKGLMQIDTEQTFVQGLYRVITLENNFVNGRFEQTLKMIRVQNQNSNDSENIPDLTNEEVVASRRFGTFNPDGTVAGPGQSARPGNFRSNPRVTVRDNRPAVQQLADPDGDGNADDPEAQVFLDPSLNRPARTNGIEDLANDPDFTFGQFGGP